MNDRRLERAFGWAKDQYQEIGVDVVSVLESLSLVPMSVHCWQGDDVAGFEPNRTTLAGSGLAVTGSCPGRARNAAELRQDLDKAFSLIPRRHRANLHAMYGEFTEMIDRDAIGPEHIWPFSDRRRGTSELTHQIR